MNWPAFRMLMHVGFLYHQEDNTAYQHRVVQYSQHSTQQHFDTEQSNISWTQYSFETCQLYNEYLVIEHLYMHAIASIHAVHTILHLSVTTASIPSKPTTGSGVILCRMSRLGDVPGGVHNL